MTEKPLTYTGSGVDYNLLDSFKVAAQEVGGRTSSNLGGRGTEISKRGDSVHLVRLANGLIIGSVEEGLGTKGLDAQEVFDTAGDPSGFAVVGQDNVAMILNDLVTAGVRPCVLNMYLSVGRSDIFNQKEWWTGILDGTLAACNEAGCILGGGETPTLVNVVMPNAFELAGGAWGLIECEDRWVRGELAGGEVIILVQVEGCNANGLSLLREVKDKLPEGFAQKLPSSQTFGQAVLQPTPIYWPLVKAILDADIRPARIENITGHGWAKLARAEGDYVAHIHRMPRPVELFEFILDFVKVKEAYKTFNMGAGFGFFVSPDDVDRVMAVCRREGYDAFVAGEVVKEDHGKKGVYIQPLGLWLDAPELR